MGCLSWVKTMIADADTNGRHEKVMDVLHAARNVVERISEVRLRKNQVRFPRGYRKRFSLEATLKIF